MFNFFKKKLPRFSVGDPVYYEVVSLWPAVVESVIDGGKRYIIQMLIGDARAIVKDKRLHARPTAGKGDVCG